jgi:transcriptional regulator with XRE-family HTH domain
MNKRAEQRRDYIQKLMRNSPMSRNQIAAVSGLSNPYIKGLELGNIANVGREKLISLGIALDLSLSDIDSLLNRFDRTPLSRDDILTFIETSKRCHISAALHPVHDSYTFDLMLLSAEQSPGSHVIVSSRPASCLREEGHRRYAEKALVEGHPIYGDLIAAINKERRNRLMANLKDHPVANFVCAHCLRDYLRHCEDAAERQWRIAHIQNTIDTIRSFDRFSLFLTEECPSFIFVLRSPADTENESEKLIITVLPPHRMSVRVSGLLAGFATDSQAVILNFKKELKFLEKSILEPYLDRSRLVGFLRDLISETDSATG